MIQSLNEMLAAAERGGYAVLAPDFSSLSMVRTLIELAEELDAPLLLSYTLALREIRDLRSYARFIGVVREEAEAAAVPVGLHLDHALTLDAIREGVEVGYTSVMIDASSEPWEVNVERTQAAVAIAHPAGVPVEAELGHVATGDMYVVPGHGEDSQTVFTDPDQAVEFVRLTGIDALAVSIGTIHGTYRGAPALQFDLLEELHRRVPVPLVLHGASDTGDDNLRRLVALGIRKINMYSDMVKAVKAELAAVLAQPEGIGAIQLAEAERRGVRREAARYFQVSGSVGCGRSGN